MVVGDKIKIKKKTGLIEPGTIFTVKKFGNYGFIFENEDTEGYMTFDNSDIFEVITERKNKNEWKHYDQVVIDVGGHEILFNVDRRIVQKRIQLRTTVGKNVLVAESVCAPEDKFDEESGTKLATIRLVSKIYGAIAEMIAEEM